MAASNPERRVRFSGLSWWYKDSDLETLCSNHGEVLGLSIEYDHANGRSLGRAEVEFSDSDAAIKAHEALKDHDFGREVSVTLPSADQENVGNAQTGASRKHDKIEPAVTARPPPIPFVGPFGQPVPRPVFPPNLSGVPPVGFQAAGFPMMMPGMMQPMPPVQPIQPVVDSSKRSAAMLIQ
mmetsp:Transcript_43407/g.169848  ORF Transcript_43407/g.169848 Transcript_43407/m.169848 type:complete len:181 (-) Transcript_43407:901-1443(-)